MSEKKIELTPALRSKIVVLVQAILDKNHSVPEKKILPSNSHTHGSQMNFACPYCGDSATDFRKKRGNLYWDNLFYHCFNAGCDKHSNLTQFLKDFGLQFETEDLFTVTTFIRENKKDFSRVESLEFGLFKNLHELAVPKDEFFISQNLEYINEKTYQAYPYLKSRHLQTRLGYFGWNRRSKQLYILNLTGDGKGIIGYQIKNLKESSRKYLTFNIERLRKEMKMDTEVKDIAEFEKIKRLSTLFGILRVDITREFTIFEGPIDSFFMENSLALGGVTKETFAFQELPTVRYFLDDDTAGRKVSIDRLKKGCKVFLWTKFMKETGYKKYKGIKDLNDLVIAIYKHAPGPIERDKLIISIENYFSSNVHDIIYL